MQFRRRRRHPKPHTETVTKLEPTLNLEPAHDLIAEDPELAAIRDRIAALPAEWELDALADTLATTRKMRLWIDKTQAAREAAREAFAAAVAAAADTAADLEILNDLADSLVRADTVAEAAGAMPVPDAHALRERALAAAVNTLRRAVRAPTLDEPSYRRERAAWRALAPQFRDVIEPPIVTPADLAAVARFERIFEAGREWSRQVEMWHRSAPELDIIGVLEVAASLVVRARELNRQADDHHRQTAEDDLARQAMGLVWKHPDIAVELSAERRILTGI